jgi:carbamoyltransferase
VWVQPAAGDSGTALGAALACATRRGDRCAPFRSAALGRGWRENEIEAALKAAEVPYHRPDDPADLAEEVAAALAGGAVVGWFEGRSEYGPRALGHRSLLCDPRRPENLGRMNAIKGREEFRPVAPMVLADRAPDIFEGVHPSPYMLFVHRVRDGWRERIPAAVHVDGTARIQTVDPEDEPLMAATLAAFERRTGVPVVVNTSFNTAGRPMVDTPRDALECYGSGPIDLLVLSPFVLRRAR